MYHFYTIFVITMCNLMEKYFFGGDQVPKPSLECATATEQLAVFFPLTKKFLK